MADDYYKTLGVSRSATPGELQKAYRRLARKHHPDLADDKDKAKTMFQKVQHAYDVLSDPKKRKLYDQLGPEFERGGNPFQGGQMPNGFDVESIFGKGGMPQGGFEDILRQVFGPGAAAGFGGGGFPGGGARTQTRQPHAQQPQAAAKGQDVQQDITIPFATAILGGKHQITLKRSSGNVENITITIPAGITNGKKIRLKGQGRSLPRGGQRGDLFVVVSVAAHPVYQRVGDNLLLELPITISEALMGGKIDLSTPQGTVTVTIPENSSSGKSLRLKGMGVKRASGTSGDLIAELKIVLPSKVTDEQREILKQFAATVSDESVRSDIKW